MLKNSQKYRALLDNIETIYNFDTGYEIENVLCNFLRNILPEKYGICRGFVVSASGGDDIIFFDQYKLPTLRFLPKGDYSLKQQIPIEAVYAYIEAKSTLNEETLATALVQVQKVKELLLSRKPLPLSCISEGVFLPSTPQRNNQHFPQYWNPPYTIIWGRNFDFKDISSFNQLVTIPSIMNMLYPDMVLSGSSVVSIPAICTQIEYPFLTNGSRLITFDNSSYIGVGVINLLSALSSIKLNDIYWPAILADCLNLGLNN